jgi:hypothetical protein
MTREETKAILAILKAGYPNFYKDLKPADADQITNLWATLFVDDPAKIVSEAVKALMCTLVYPPTIADVKEKIALITQPQTMTEMEAWGQVLSAISNANYHAQQGFDDLPPVVQKIVGSPNQLREWAMMDSEVVNSVIQSNFMRSYTARVKAEKEYTALPESAKQLLEESKMKMLEAAK